MDRGCHPIDWLRSNGNKFCTVKHRDLRGWFHALVRRGCDVERSRNHDRSRWRVPFVGWWVSKQLTHLDRRLQFVLL